MSTPIIFSIHDSDSNYWPYLAVAINSILLNSSSCHNFYILHNETLNTEAITNLNGLVHNKGSNLTFISVKLPSEIINLDYNRFSPASIFRLLIPKIFRNEELVIYLDSDLIFHGIDLIELINSASNHPISAVVDPYIGYSIKHKKHLASFNLEIETYFNSGVLAMRPKQLPEDLINKFIYFIKNYPIQIHPDQDFLNFEFKNNWGELDRKFNHHACVMNLSLFQPISSYFNKVIHYVGAIKPLQGYIAPAFVPFWTYTNGINKIYDVFDTNKLSILFPNPSNKNDVITKIISSQ